MEANIKYITQLSKEDLRQLAKAANLYAGEGIIITRNDDGLCVKVDTSMLQMWVRHIMNGGSIG